jgi:hypothetical protein
MAKEIRKDLAAAQRELEEAQAYGPESVEVVRSCIRLAKAHITDALRKLG